MRQPKIQFANLQELEECGKYWEKKLLMHDWIIKYELNDKVTTDKGDDCYGLNSHNPVTREAIIRISKYDESRDTKTARKYCAEQTLVHELLHCIYNLMENESTFEGVYYGTREHQLLDRMADSLIMAKYNISFEFFRNKKD